MSTTLALSALLMGLAGGPHCAAMCGPACGAIVRLPGARPPSRGLLQFQAGRLLGYSLAGAIAAGAAQSLAWMSAQAIALQPVWTLFHLAVLAWGLMLVAQARQPAWAGGAGRWLWTRVRPLAGATGGRFGAGMLWALLPCGLLYSALLVAALSGGPLDGALSMALFALGSAVSLSLAPALLLRLERAGTGDAKAWGARAAGGLLVLAALWALWMDTAQRIAQWCGLA